MKLTLIFKIIFIIITLISYNIAYAGYGIIISYKAPLFKNESKNSKIVQYLNKGTKIYIHDEDLNENPTRNSNIFYMTIDKLGRQSYIEAQFVKLIYNDDRENFSAVNISGHDPTNYLLDEPLPDNYPFIKSKRHYGSIALGLGTERKSTYPYTSNIAKEDYSSKKDITLSHLSNLDFDPERRLFFGVQYSFSYEENNFKLSNNGISNEKSREYSIGPIISYDFFRNNNFKLTLSGSISLTYHIKNIVQTREANTVNAPLYDSYSDARIFKGISIGPRVSLAIQRRFTKDLYYFTSANLITNTPYSLKSDTPKATNQIWQDTSKDKISIPIGRQVSVLFGISAYI